MYPAVQSSDQPFARFPARRSAVHSTKGMVACTQPLAAQAGQKILAQGGNAADAAIAVAAALNMTEPASTGLGGDAFCLFYNEKSRTVHALNASGRSAKNTTLAQVRRELGGQSKGKIPFGSPLAVTVPGAAAGWVDAVELFGSGKLTLGEILQPAIELGEEGFPVSEISASMWKNGETKLKAASPNGLEMLKPDGRSPRSGEIFRNPHLAKTLRVLAAEGKKGIYCGRIADAIVDVLQQKGSHMELSDLEDYAKEGSRETQPVSLQFKGQGVTSRAGGEDFIELWEHPPNGQGIVALMALGFLEELEKTHQAPTFNKGDHNTAVYLHTLVECFRIAFADANWWVTDPDCTPVSPQQLVSRPYLAERARLFKKDTAVNHAKGQPFDGVSPAQNRSDTVVFGVIDAEGNAMSVVNSNFMEFGSGIVPKDCGFALQNRGAGFHLGPDNHPNVYQGGKRPYHTIIPCLATQGPKRDLHSVFGVMGGLMQPQGQVQVLLNMEVFGMTPQEAVDAPRFCIENPMPPNLGGTGAVYLEEGIDEAVAEELRAMGHDVQLLKGWSRNRFGRGQAIRQRIDEEGRRILTGGSDGRGDGIALPC
ncbi:gamma-glutamyltransferase [Exophiala viscosa]|uniref:Gamma-glutamyltransferase n=1 Tax=Exophiala viscosa TaxID=2486360 RepID=A0AAN6DQS6_9EURO|nr:gamma-glutamyltransferase [Exophiala viscosa]KAI1625207.1 gamma-glutamyltransferase [Exophiala viscosa]